MVLKETLILCVAVYFPSIDTTYLLRHSHICSLKYTPLHPLMLSV
ncbi:hypothetical protein AHF37_05837 [Paragonimus kellicotti]|nr:hypothetical protein AHF37_05837 [Paragonimus kellicotti]